jgi:hypothetical protein
MPKAARISANQNQITSVDNKFGGTFDPLVTKSKIEGMNTSTVPGNMMIAFNNCHFMSILFDGTNSSTLLIITRLSSWNIVYSPVDL